MNARQLRRARRRKRDPKVEIGGFRVYWINRKRDGFPMLVLKSEYETGFMYFTRTRKFAACLSNYRGPVRYFYTLWEAASHMTQLLQAPKEWAR